MTQARQRPRERDEEVIRNMTSRSIPLSQIAAELGKSKAWVCTQRKLIMADDPKRPNRSIPRGNRADAVMMLLKFEDLERLREAAEARGTTIAGLGAAIMKVCAKEQSIIDAILDEPDEDDEEAGR